MGLNRSRLPSSTLRSCEKWARDILEEVASPPTRTWTLDQVSLKSSDLSASALPPTPKGSRLSLNSASCPARGQQASWED